MLSSLKFIEAMIPELIRSHRDRWSGLYVGYHPPFVHRAWIQIDDTYRLYLHVIEPCSAEGALFHPHPWPSAIKIVNGVYEMRVGYGKGDEAPPVASTLILPAGSYYEMVEPDGWHSVRPVGAKSLSIMVTGKPWERSSPGGGQATKMGITETNNILDQFEQYFTLDI